MEEEAAPEAVAVIMQGRGEAVIVLEPEGAVAAGLEEAVVDDKKSSYILKRNVYLQKGHLKFVQLAFNILFNSSTRVTYPKGSSRAR